MTMPNNRLYPNIKFIIQAALFAFGIISARLIYLQINLAEQLNNKSKQNFQRIAKIQPMRGNILDCTGKLLATNRPVIDLFWQGTGNNRFSPEQKKVLEIVASIISTPLDSTQELWNDLIIAERFYKQIPLASDLSFEQVSKLEELFPSHKNIMLSTRFARFYPYKSYASHLLGYLGDLDISMHGKMGLEMLLQDKLEGEYGIILRTINSLGKKLSEQEIKASLEGCNILTTLDINLQQIVEEIFPEEYNGTIILMDPADGAIKALCSRPSFDPSLFLGPISMEDWHILQEKKIFINRAFNATYPLGSIFKLVVVSAALEQGVIDAESTWNCRGSIEFGNRTYWCMNHFGHGELNTTQAVAKSCNTFFYEIGKRMNVDQIALYARLFGLGEKTGIIFHEKEGIVPSKAWKQATLGEKWWPGETLSVAIGQSYLTVTPIQIARMISSIFTKSLITPRILVAEPIIKRPLEIRSETLKLLRQSMRKVVTIGTGQRVNHLKDIEIYAKTSTAQVSGLDKHGFGKSHFEHGWFVAYFKYKNYDPLTLVILIEHAESSSLATLTANNFLVRYKQYKDNLENCASEPAESAGQEFVEAIWQEPIEVEQEETAAAPIEHATHTSGVTPGQKSTESPNQNPIAATTGESVEAPLKRDLSREEQQ